MSGFCAIISTHIFGLIINLIKKTTKKISYRKYRRKSCQWQKNKRSLPTKWLRNHQAVVPKVRVPPNPSRKSLLANQRLSRLQKNLNLRLEQKVLQKALVSKRRRFYIRLTHMQPSSTKTQRKMTRKSSGSSRSSKMSKKVTRKLSATSSSLKERPWIDLRLSLPPQPSWQLMSLWR